MKYYFIICFEKLEFDEFGIKYGSKRCIGFYTNFDKAESIVLNNTMDIHETIYNYVMIEEYNEGIYNYNSNRWLYKFNGSKYEKINEPEQMKYYAMFSMG